MKAKFIGSISLIAIMALTGCDSSSNSSSGSDNSSASATTTPTSQTKTGYFIDSAVAGLDYNTSSGLSGTTDKFGKFEFKSNDRVTFSIGDLVLGNVKPSGKVVTPNDIADSNETATKVLQILQSLDSDKNATNGIEISADVKKQINESLAKPKKLDEFKGADGKVDDTKIIDALKPLKAKLDKDGDGAIDIDEEKALSHFKDSLEKISKGKLPNGEKVDEKEAKKKESEAKGINEKIKDIVVEKSNKAQKEAEEVSKKAEEIIKRATKAKEEAEKKGDASAKKKAEEEINKAKKAKEDADKKAEEAKKKADAFKKGNNSSANAQGWMNKKDNNKTDVDNNKTKIDTKADNKTDMKGNNNSNHTDNNKTDFNNNKTKVDNNTTKIDNNKTKIDDKKDMKGNNNSTHTDNNKTDFNNNKSKVDNNSTSADNNKTKVDNNKTKVDNKTDMKGNNNSNHTDNNKTGFNDNKTKVDGKADNNAGAKSDNNSTKVDGKKDMKVDNNSTNSDNNKTKVDGKADNNTSAQSDSNSTSVDNTNSKTQKGQFVDSPVAGLEYNTTSGLHGKTDAEGYFEYKKGDKVTFKIGNLILGSTEITDKIKEPVVTPTDISANDKEVEDKMLQLLQTLDSDENASNGIVISQEAKSELEQIGDHVRFKDLKDKNGTINDKKLLEKLPTIRDILDRDGNGILDVNKTQALKHFKDTLNRFKDKNRFMHNFNDWFAKHKDNNSTKTDMNKDNSFEHNSHKSKTDVSTNNKVDNNKTNTHSKQKLEIN